jgi:hypothetical protein
MAVDTVTGATTVVIITKSGEICSGPAGKAGPLLLR